MLQDTAVIQDRMNRQLRDKNKKKGHQALMTTVNEEDEEEEDCVDPEGDKDGRG